MRSVFCLLALAGSLAAQGGPPALYDALYGEVARLVGRFRETTRARGVVVGVLRGEEREVFAFGDGGKGVGRPLGGDTIFEIGSITKAFTGVALASLVESEIVSLRDEVATLLPRRAGVPSRDGRRVTLLDLATHRSGLPRLPSNLKPRVPPNPYADYTAERLFSFLERHRLRRLPGVKYEYSNLGYGLLGFALSREVGQSFEALVKEHVCSPLGLKDTTIRLSEKQKRRLARPHLANGARGYTWDFDAIAAAGALRSTANDLLVFASANLGPGKTVLARAMATSHVPRQETAAKGIRIGLGWHVSAWSSAEDPLVWHNGRTGGYGCILLFLKSRKLAVVVLCNQSLNVDKLGGDVMRVLAK